MKEKKILDKIHFGSLVKSMMKEKDLKDREVMMSIRYSRDKLKSLYKRQHLNSDELFKLSLLLDYNFFEVLSDYYVQVNTNEIQNS
jgi:hypothetical protein